MKKDNIYSALLFAAIIVGLFVTLIHTSHKEAAKKIDREAQLRQLEVKCDSLQQRYDSLSGELFTYQIDLQRYEYIMEQLEELPGSDCKQQLEEILKHTE